MQEYIIVLKIFAAVPAKQVRQCTRQKNPEETHGKLDVQRSVWRASARVNEIG